MVFLLVLAAPQVAKSEHTHAFANLTPAQGLASPSVRSIHHGRSGLLWIGTLDGLQRYDGHVLRDFRPSPRGAGGSSGQIVDALLEDRSGQLWIGIGAPVVRLDLASERFLPFEPDPGRDWSSDLVVKHMIEEDSGVLWLATSTGLARWDRSIGKLDFFRGETGATESLPGVELMELAQDHRGVLWIATWGGGIVRFDHRTMTFRNYRHDPADSASLSSDLVYSVAFDARGFLWAGTYGGGLSRFDPENGTFTRLLHDPGESHSLSSDFVTDLVVTADNHLWIGTDGAGVDHLDLETADLESARFDHHTSGTGAGRLANDTINDLALDHFGRLWIATVEGVSLLDLRRQPLENYRHDPLDTGSLSPGMVRTLVEDESGIVWVGTGDGSINRLDRLTGSITHYQRIRGEDNSLNENRVERLLVDRQGDLWIATTYGLNRLVRGSDSFLRYLHDPADSTTLAANWVSDLDQDEDGHLWVATYAGLDRLDPEDGAFVHVLDGTPAAGLAVLSVEAGASRVWAGTYKDGLILIEGGTVSRFRHDPEDPHFPSSDTISQILEDRRGRVWLASAAGLDLLDAESLEVTASYVTDSDAPAAVYAVAEDHGGDLWLNTQRGLFRFDPEGGSMIAYDREDGLCCRSYMWAAATSRAGEIIVGGWGGVSVFHPDDLETAELDAPVLLTELQINGAPVPVAAESLLERTLHQADHLELTHTDRIVSVDFAGLGVALPSKSRYRYRLKGFQDPWVELGPAERTATFTNLPAGNYVLEVQAGARDGSWGLAGASLDLTMAAPWWQTLWFRLLFLLAVAGVLALAYRRRTRSMAARTLELSAEVERRRVVESELRHEMERRTLAEQEARQQRAALAHATRVTTLGELTASLAHELNQPLTAVVSNSQAAERFLRAAEPDLEEVSAALREVAADGRRAGDVIQHMRDLLKKGADHRQPVNVRQLILATEPLIHSELILRRIELHLELAKDLMVEADPVQLQQVIMNLVVNAFEAFDGSEGRPREISIVATIEEGDIVVEVCDSGPGIDHETREHLFEPFRTTKSNGLGLGLVISKSIVENHRGRLWVSASSPAGTTFSLRLPRAAAASAPQAPMTLGEGR